MQYYNMQYYIEKEIHIVLQTQRLLCSILPISCYHYISCLGTHSFYFLFLPLLFWTYFEWIPFGRGLVFLLAFGVYVSGFLKDWYGLPRPKHSKLKSYKVKTYHSDEYGFPSTHAANAISISLYCYFYLENLKLFPKLCLLLFTLLICLSRIGLGLHGFIDIMGGLIIGSSLTLIYMTIQVEIENWITNSSFLHLGTQCTIALVLLLYIHPEPKRYCPCFIDSISFLSVLYGAIMGENALHKYSIYSIGGNHLHSIYKNDLFVISIKIVLGLLILSVWRNGIKKIFSVHFKKSHPSYIPRFDYEMNVRILTYVGIGFITVFLIPLSPIVIIKLSSFDH